jgi:hypothetical protein
MNRPVETYEELLAVQESLGWTGSFITPRGAIWVARVFNKTHNIVWFVGAPGWFITGKAIMGGYPNTKTLLGPFDTLATAVTTGLLTGVIEHGKS